MTNDVIDNNDSMIDINRIMAMIPHRYPFLLIDRVNVTVKGEEAVGLKNVTINEPFFNGHFPAQPVMPGVLLIEAMAQTSAVLVVHTLGMESEGRLVYFMSIEEARFRRPVTPGDSLRIHVKKLQSRANVWKFDCEIKVEENKVAEATISAMIMNK